MEGCSRQKWLGGCRRSWVMGGVKEVMVVGLAAKGSAELDGKGGYMEVGESLVRPVDGFTRPKRRWEEV